MNQADDTPRSQADSFPVADVQPGNGLVAGKLLESKMWWITLICLGVAIYLAWASHRPTGINITIDFPEGHGLKAGDALRHRGIDIGIVTAVELAADLHGVRTNVTMEKSAAGIANEKSQFWIVRPHLSLTDVSGLETAVGAKYIAVHPGPAGSTAARQFEGREDAPAVIPDAEGIEIALRGVESFGINPGSPVTYRGIRVGRILSVDLGGEAMSVLIRARIDKDYKSLLRRGSRFWKTSGVDVDFGLKGFHLSTESLATMARGGVSFVTPKTRNESDLDAIESGHEFELVEKANDHWIRDAAVIEIHQETIQE